MINDRPLDYPDGWLTSFRTQSYRVFAFPVHQIRALESVILIYILKVRVRYTYVSFKMSLITLIGRACHIVWPIEDWISLGATATTTALCTVMLYFFILTRL
jgi:hypothetical protein